MLASTADSPHARLSSLPLNNIIINHGFWLQRQEINHTNTLIIGYRKLEAAGNFHNFRMAAGLTTGDYQGPLFMDENVYKWLEAVAYEIQRSNDNQLSHLADQVIDLIAATQAEDGYINTYFQVVEPDKRWTDLDHGHELYCAGHLIQAAIAHHRATGKTNLLNIATRFADHIWATFGPNRRTGACGHPEIEMALVELYRQTQQKNYLQLAEFFVNQRGQHKMRGLGPYGPEYHQDRVPVRLAQEIEGHAVRQLYLLCGITDIFMETGEAALIDSLQRLWRDMSAHKMFITGGYGSRYEGESFGDPYELPSDRCYCETCAAVGAMMWNWRMLLATGEARFADNLERSLYNGFLGGISLDGQRFFYVNPLQSNGGLERADWYRVACCPPNIMRQIAALSHYIATQDQSGVQVHQYISSQIKVERPSGSDFQLKVNTNYPWNGTVEITIERGDTYEWCLSLRIPAWCLQPSLLVNGRPVSATLAAGSYARLERNWQSGDVVELHLPLAPRLTQPHPRIDALRGQLAIERGPLVYCLEQVDQPFIVDLRDVRIDPRAPLRETWQGDLLGGVVTIEAQGAIINPETWADQLYRTYPGPNSPKSPITLIAIPYYAWANRDPGAMRVWIPSISM